MAITQAMCTSFKVGILDGDFNFGAGTTQTFKIALYTSSATLSAATTAYTSSNEVSGTGYSAGGQALSVAQVPTSSGTTAFLDFSDVTWTTATITARGALIYKFGSGNPTVCVLDFGADKTSTSTFTVQFPAVTNTAAIIRIS